MRKHINVILNPVAGGSAGRKSREGLERRLNARDLHYVLHETEGPGHATDLAHEAAAAGAAIVLVAGGDGTVHEAANGLLAYRQEHGAPDTALAVYPVGTGNDFVKLLYSPRDPDLACDVLLNGRLRHFDAGRVTWNDGSEFFINAAGTGVDVEVVRQIRKLPRIRGALSYLIGLTRTVFQFKPLQLRVSFDGQPVERNVLMMAVTNGLCLGGGFYICPAALPDDGYFDTIMVEELSYLGIVRAVPRVMRGTHEKLAEVSMQRARKVEIESMNGMPLYFQLDGELREPISANSMTFELNAGVLPVLTAPAGSSADARSPLATDTSGIDGPVEETS